MALIAACDHFLGVIAEMHIKLKLFQGWWVARLHTLHLYA